MSRASLRPDDEVETSRRYFGSFAEDYHRAFAGTGDDRFHGTINRLFRRKTFERRTGIVKDLLSRYGVRGKQVLDLGSGSGEVSLVAARLGAAVTGLDVVPEMVAIAQREAERAGLSAQASFRVHDIVRQPVPDADVTMMIGVIEYYSDLEPILGKVAGATRELVIICDTRGPWWRRMLRYGLARLKHFYLHYHSPDTVAQIMARHSFGEAARIAGHSFTVMAFQRR
jgi:2-polyprenyl-3-methyl-5-hydroxy-6-metoxy-1,4-benzoquinol methylase